MPADSAPLGADSTPRFPTNRQHLFRLLRPKFQLKSNCNPVARSIQSLLRKFESAFRGNLPDSFSPARTIVAKQILTILDATGKQGGSVVKSILADSKASSRFKVRAVTRDPTEDSAKALKALGAEVVAVGIHKPSSLDILLLLDLLLGRHE